MFLQMRSPNLPYITQSLGKEVQEDPKFHFSQLQNLAKENSITELSIGMSGDYKEALLFNPTYIRLGTILFGERS